MARYDVVDRFLIEAPPSIVWEAFHAELRGESDWWMPHLQAIPRDLRPPTVGSTFEIHINPPGRIHRWLLKPRFTVHVIDAVAPEMFSVEFPEGDFVGTGLFTFTPINDGTLLRFDWNVETAGPRSSLIGMFFNIGVTHSVVVQLGFQSLDRLLQSTRVTVDSGCAKQHLSSLL